MKRFNWSRSLVKLIFRNTSTRGRVLFNSPSRLHPDNTIINIRRLFKSSFRISIELLCVAVCLIAHEPTYPRESTKAGDGHTRSCELRTAAWSPAPAHLGKNFRWAADTSYQLKAFPPIFTLVMWYTHMRCASLVQSGAASFPLILGPFGRFCFASVHCEWRTVLLCRLYKWCSRVIPIARSNVPTLKTSTNHSAATFWSLQQLGTLLST